MDRIDGSMNLMLHFFFSFLLYLLWLMLSLFCFLFVPSFKGNLFSTVATLTIRGRWYYAHLNWRLILFIYFPLLISELAFEVTTSSIVVVAEGQQIQLIPLQLTFPVLSASIVDPFVAICTQNGRLLLYELDNTPHVHLKVSAS